MKEINTIEDFSYWVSENNFESLLISALHSYFEMWLLTVPLAVAYKNALNDLWEEHLLMEYPGFKFNCKKEEILKWCDEDFGVRITIS